MRLLHMPNIQEGLPPILLWDTCHYTIDKPDSSKQEYGEAKYNCMLP